MSEVKVRELSRSSVRVNNQGEVSGLGNRLGDRVRC